jgi:FxsC-like protein
VTSDRPAQEDDRPSQDDEGPFFFLSYAHAPRHGADDPDDRDYWISKFFDDLRAEIAQTINVEPGAAGFMDRELRPGNEWPSRLAQSLATCRVFVPLYSRRYFTSEHCGKEWFAFTARSRSPAPHRERVETIIPALWVPVDDPFVPEAARTIDFNPAQLGDRYARHGLYGLMKLTRYRDDYEHAVFLLAQQIVEAAMAQPLGPVPVFDYDSLPNAFGDPNAPPHADRRLRIIIAAPDRSNLPGGRSGDFYGSTACDWNPYGPDTLQPLADYAANIARSLGYQPDVGSLTEREEELLRSGPPDSPAVLLVDPWAATVPRTQAALKLLGDQSAPWVSVVVTWNRKDAETAAMEGQLRDGVEGCLGRKLVDAWAAASSTAGAPSIEHFSATLPLVVRTAVRHYLRYAPARPPDGSPPRPILGVGAPDAAEPAGSGG